jgi:uncharacterized protein YeaO (DUF488 family)
MTLVLDTNEFRVIDRAEVVREAIATTIVPVEIAWPNRTTRYAHTTKPWFPRLTPPTSLRWLRGRRPSNWPRSTPRLHEVLPRRHHRADGVLAVVLEGHRIPDGQSHDRRTHVPSVMLHAPLRTLLYADRDGDTKLAVDQPSLLSNSYDCADIAEVGTELDDLLAQLIRRLGSQFTIPTDGTST